MHDIEAFERKAREMMARMRERGAEAVARGEANEPFYKAQCAFEEARILFSLAPVRLDNDGIPDIDIYSAAGAAIGAIYANLLASVINKSELREALDEWINRATNDIIQGFVTGQSGVDGVEFEIVTTEKTEPMN